MKKLYIVFLLIFLCGCAAYKYELSQKKYDKGFIVRRHGLLIPEYTIDDQQKAPKQKQLAQMRFKRRKVIVSYYYKQMGLIYNDAMTRTADFGNMMTGIFRLPGAVKENKKYETDEEYRKHSDKELAEEETAVIAKRQSLREQLAEYIKRDIEFEKSLE
ncbi:MAG: hypothetical protein P9L96_00510 [Candidatus Gygaella obscura]|nr:hypothetical protein [Candidatus Gygaella obscura]